MTTMGKAKFKCALCGKLFEGYFMMICDECLDQRRESEPYDNFVKRMEHEKAVREEATR
jgi:hypothetical protein